MARLSPPHDAVPRVGSFLNTAVGVVEMSAQARNISTGIGVSGL
jgi:hypothetical protein